MYFALWLSWNGQGLLSTGLPRIVSNILYVHQVGNTTVLPGLVQFLLLTLTILPLSNSLKTTPKLRQSLPHKKGGCPNLAANSLHHPYVNHSPPSKTIILNKKFKR